MSLYKIIVESAPNMIWKSGLDAKCNFFNKTWLEFTGRTFEQEIGDGWAEGVHQDDFENCLKIYLESFNKRRPFEMEYRLRRYDGEYRWINDRGVPYFDSVGDFCGFIGSCIDVTEKIEGEKLKLAAQVDGLTGTNNRQYFEQLLDKEFEKAVKNKSLLSVILIDVDSFKSINDTYGHLAGDYVLLSLVKIIQVNLRETDICCRYGGEEFVVALPNTPLKQALYVAERLRQQIENYNFEFAGTIIKLTASLGVAMLSDEKDPSKLIDKADKAMYNSKSKGKNLVSMFK